VRREHRIGVDRPEIAAVDARLAVHGIAQNAASAAPPPYATHSMPRVNHEIVARIVDEGQPIEHLGIGADAQDGSEAGLDGLDVGQRAGGHVVHEIAPRKQYLPRVIEIQPDLHLRQFLSVRVIGLVELRRFVADPVETAACRLD